MQAKDNNNRQYIDCTQKYFQTAKCYLITKGWSRPMDVPSPGSPTIPTVLFWTCAQNSMNLSILWSICKVLVSYSASRSIRIWKASSVLVPRNIISGRSRPSKGILPTMSSCCWLSSQNSTPLNFITMGSLGLYTENSEATVMLFCSSGVYTSPIFLGGKGTSWQDVAMQGSSVLGTQVLFHPHSVVNSSWRLPFLEDNWSGVKVPQGHFLREGFQ